MTLALVQVARHARLGGPDDGDLARGDRRSQSLGDGDRRRSSPRCGSSEQVKRVSAIDRRAAGRRGTGARGAARRLDRAGPGPAGAASGTRPGPSPRPPGGSAGRWCGASTSSRPSWPTSRRSYDLVHDEVEDTALDVAAALRSVRARATACSGRVRRLLVPEPAVTPVAARAGPRRRGAPAPGASRPGPRLDARARTSISASRSWRTWRCCPPPWPTCSAPIPFDFLYGNIAADSSIAKHYAPLGRHCHYWHVGQEIHDLARVRRAARLRAGLPLPPRRRHRRPQLLRAPPAHAHQQHGGGGPLLLGDPGRDPPRATRTRRPAKDVILLDHSRGRRAPRPASSRRRSSACGPTAGCSAAWCTSPRPPSWQRATQVAREYSRWRLADRGRRAPPRPVLRLHDRAARRPRRQRASARPLGRAAAQGGQGAAPPGAARRPAGGTRPGSARRRWSTSACPTGRSRIGPASPQKLPWRAPEGAAPSPKALVNGRLSRSSMNADDVIRRLGLLPHPEGGFYRETFRSRLTAQLPDGRSGRLHRHPLSPARRHLERLAPGARRTRSGITTTAARSVCTGWASGRRSAASRRPAGGRAGGRVAGGGAGGGGRALRVHRRAGLRLRGLRAGTRRRAGGRLSGPGAADPDDCSAESRRLRGDGARRRADRRAAGGGAVRGPIGPRAQQPVDARTGVGRMAGGAGRPLPQRPVAVDRCGR